MADGYFNPFSKYFLRGKPSLDVVREKQINKNSQGINDQDAYYKYLFGQQYGSGYGDGFANVYVAPIHFDQYFQTKKIRIIKYREMSFYPEINDALDVVSDEAIVEDDKGDIVTLNIRREVTKLEERKLKEQWDYVINDVFNAKETLWDLFRKWLVEAELYLEIVINDKKDKVIGLRSLPAFITYPVYDGSKIAYFIQKILPISHNAANYQTPSPDNKENKHQVVFPCEQIAYANYGGYPGTSRADVRGYLEPAIRVYNMLRSLEDAVVVYRLTRAPERRVWNIEVGRMPTGKVEEYIKRLIHKYRRQLNYNPNTGAIDASQNIQALSEDFWFAKRDGNGTNVDTLPSGSNLGELGDLEFFNEKLLTILKIPKGRGTNSNTSTYQSGTNIERDELKFWNFVQRLQKRFKKIIMDVFIQQLRLQNFDTRLLDRKIYNIHFTEANFFKELKELNLLETKLNVFSSLSTFIISEENPDAEFSWEFVAKDMMHMSDDEFQKNETLKDKERKKIFEKIEFKAELVKHKLKTDPPIDPETGEYAVNKGVSGQSSDNTSSIKKPSTEES